MKKKEQLLRDIIKSYERLIDEYRNEIQRLLQLINKDGCLHDFTGIPASIKCHICGYYRS